MVTRCGWTWRAAQPLSACLASTRPRLRRPARTARGRTGHAARPPRNICAVWWMDTGCAAPCWIPTAMAGLWRAVSGGNRILRRKWFLPGRRSPFGAIQWTTSPPRMPPARNGAAYGRARPCARRTGARGIAPPHLPPRGRPRPLPGAGSRAISRPTGISITCPATAIMTAPASTPARANAGFVPRKRPAAPAGGGRVPIPRSPPARREWHAASVVRGASAGRHP